MVGAHLRDVIHWRAKGNRLLPAEDVDVLSKPSIKQPIQDPAWRK